MNLKYEDKILLFLCCLGSHIMEGSKKNQALVKHWFFSMIFNKQLHIDNADFIFLALFTVVERLHS
jgi:hypothetical protein